MIKLLVSLTFFTLVSCLQDKEQDLKSRESAYIETNNMSVEDYYGTVSALSYSYKEHCLELNSGYIKSFMNKQSSLRGASKIDLSPTYYCDCRIKYAKELGFFIEKIDVKKEFNNYQDIKRDYTDIRNFIASKVTGGRNSISFQSDMDAKRGLCLQSTAELVAKHSRRY